MLCASLVLWLMHHNVRNVRCGRTIATLLVMTYLALCSNLYSVVILIAYIGAVLLLDLKTNDLTSYIRRNAPYLIVVILWGIIQLMESSGQRANTYGFLHKPLIHCLAVTTYPCNYVKNSMNATLDLYQCGLQKTEMLSMHIFVATKKHCLLENTCM